MKRKTKFLYNGILLTAVGLAMRGTQLLFGAYIARTLGAEGVGLNTLVMMVYSFALTFATSGISLTVTRLVAAATGEGREEEIGGIIKGAFSYAFIFGSVASLALLLLSDIIGNRIIGDGFSVAALRLLSLSLLPSAFSAVISGYFIANRRVTINAITQVTGQLLRIVITVLLLTRSGGSPISMLAVGVSASEILSLLISAPTFLLERAAARKKSKAQLAPVAKMALPLGISAYLRSALLTLEHNLIPKSLLRHGESKAEALSSYGYLHGMALPFILYPMTPLTSFSGLLVPEFAEEKGRGNREKMASIATRALNTTLTYAVLSSVLILLFSREFGYTVYASSEAGRYIAMLAPVVPIMYIDHVADAILKGIGEHIYSMWVNILDAILSIVLVLTLIPIMGISGYAVVIIVMEVFNFLLSAIRLRTRIAFRIDFARSVFLPALAMTACAVLSRNAFLMSAEQTTPLWLILRIIFTICAYVATRVTFSLILSLFRKVNKANNYLHCRDKKSRLV
ncbi:MAG: oligosaccharide flippase family protein [Clostridia bacterium]|nr:oligosaccharide flippase family protein [Clostridia bacterium]